VADDPDAILYDAARDLIYAVSGEAGVGTLIDPGTKKIVGTIPLGAKAESAAIDPASGLLYQNLESANSLAIIDLDKRRIVDRQPLGPCKGPSGIAIDAKLRRAFIVCGGNAMLVVFDLVDHHIVTSMAIGSKPDVVDFDPVLKRIYATGLAGTLSIVQQKSADTYELLDEISTHFWAHTLAVDPATHKVYIAYAGLMVAPRVAVFSSVID
jgi:DNA-binding beta-propeller fold protein YncE